MSLNIPVPEYLLKIIIFLKRLISSLIFHIEQLLIFRFSDLSFRCVTQLYVLALVRALPMWETLSPPSRITAPWEATYFSAIFV